VDLAEGKVRKLALVLIAILAMGRAQATGQIDWIWDRETAGCGLRQAYDDKGNVIEISSTPGNDGTSVEIDGPASADGLPHQLPNSTVDFKPDGRAGADLSISGDKTAPRITVDSIDPDFRAEFSRSSALLISHQSMGAIQVPIRPASAAVDALRHCEDQKMRAWGIDPVAWRALKSRPVPVSPPRTWFAGAEYPFLYRLYGIEGEVDMRVNVGADGLPKTCTPLDGKLTSPFSPAETFRGIVCTVIKQSGRFKPALDSNGNPTPAPYVVIVKFQATNRS
jgi:hypothetical protein